MQQHKYVKFIHFDFELDPLAPFQHLLPLTWVSSRCIIWYSWPNIKTMESCSMKAAVAFSICSWRLSNSFCVRGCFTKFFLLAPGLARRAHCVQYLPDSHYIPQHSPFKKKESFSVTFIIFLHFLQQINNLLGSSVVQWSPSCLSNALRQGYELNDRGICDK